MQLSRSPEKLRRALEKAEGSSEFVIIVVCDVRGFSDFSTAHESPDTAMYIKRLYLQLLTKYFPTAKFAKPTGDGLLLIFPYTEATLHNVARRVISACFRCLADFPTICQDDPMINFEPPQRVGFGITRGPACCLFSGKEILDYSGHLLNLASRLMDLARPSGILIDGSFLKGVIPAPARKQFDEAKVYIRSVSEEEPSTVFFSKDSVQLTESALNPIKSPNWKTQMAVITRKKLETMPGHFAITLPSKAVSRNKIAMALVYPNRKLAGYTTRQAYSDFRYDDDGSQPMVQISAKTLSTFLKAKKVKLQEPFNIEVRYVAK